MGNEIIKVLDNLGEKKILLDLSDKINAMNDINAELSDTIHKINNSNRNWRFYWRECEFRSQQNRRF